MKQYLTVVFALLTIVLVTALFFIKNNDISQLDTANGSIADYSNRLDTASAQIANNTSALITLTNSLTDCQSNALAFSNQLTEAQATVVSQSDQMTGLNRQITAASLENQTLNANIMDLTNQIILLNKRLSLTEATLTQTNDVLVQSRKDYALLQNRFLRDVAERTVVERRFNNLLEVKAQEKKLLKNPAAPVTPESIYAGLNVEVTSNGVAHVIAPE